MSLAEQINALEHGVQCVTCLWYEKQSDDIRSEFDAYIEFQAARPAPSYKPLWELLAGNGLATDLRSFRDHVHRHHKQ